MDVLILTEHGKDIGYGHINRCTALADGFSEYNCNITIVSRGSSGPYDLNRNYKFSKKEWKNYSFLKKVLPQFQITVVDSYQVPDNILRYIGENSNLPVYLIDSEMKFYPAGIVLFPSTYTDKNECNEFREIELLKGKEYILFTKELWKTTNVKIRKNLSRIGISLGGIANKAVVELLETARGTLQNLDDVFIFGELNETIKKKISRWGYKTRGFLKKEEYVNEVKQMDIMICNGGQSLNECLLLGMPTISFICADNQENNSKTWEDFGITSSIDVRQGLDKTKLKEKLFEITSYKHRLEINKKCKEIIDHKGALRSAKRILEKAKL